MRASYFLFLILLSACGDSKSQKVRIIDSALDPQVQRFERMAAEHNRELKFDKLTVRFGETKDPIHGMCKDEGGHIEVTISNQIKWSEWDELEREQNMFHQLGHCLLRKQHNNGWFEGNRHNLPGKKVQSVMNSDHQWVRRWYPVYRLEYIEELFK